MLQSQIATMLQLTTMSKTNSSRMINEEIIYYNRLTVYNSSAFLSKDWASPQVTLGMFLVLVTVFIWLWKQDDHLNEQMLPTSPQAIQLTYELTTFYVGCES